MACWLRERRSSILSYLFDERRKNGRHCRRIYTYVCDRTRSSLWSTSVLHTRRRTPHRDTPHAIQHHARKFFLSALPLSEPDLRGFLGVFLFFFNFRNNSQIYSFSREILSQRILFKLTFGSSKLHKSFYISLWWQIKWERDEWNYISIQRMKMWSRRLKFMEREE